MSNELNPCPFCGHEQPHLERVGSRRQSCIVACGNCGARHESSDEWEKSGASWNTRILPAASEAGAVHDVDAIQRMPTVRKALIDYHERPMNDKACALVRAILNAAPPEKQASHSEGDAGGVRVPIELANRVDDALGRFTSDEGWGQADMDTADDFSALLAAPTVPHSLTVAQGDELRAALVRIRKHIGQHEIHGALKEVDAALARLSGERSHGDERATLARLEAACAALCKMRTQEQYLSMVNAGQQDALLELDSSRAAARATLAQQSGHSGELAQGERAAFEEHMNSTGFIWEADRERDVDGDEQYADVETRVNFGVWQAAIDWSRQQGGSDANAVIAAVRNVISTPRSGGFIVLNVHLESLRDKLKQFDAARAQRSGKVE